jgi:hypothetical protein
MRDQLPVVLLLLALVIVSAIGGALIRSYELAPYRVAADGIKTAGAIIDKLRKRDVAEFLEFADVAPASAPQERIRTFGSDALTDPVLFFGGRFQFPELCGADGCLAVEFGRDKQPIRAIPYRPEEIFRANITDEYPYETNLFSFTTDACPTGVLRFGNGDLLVVFRSDGTFPFGGGVARVDAAGHPRWFRRDYGHHWATRVDDDRLLVPGMRVGQGAIKFKIGRKNKKLCQGGRPLLDTVNVVDGNGRLTAQLPMLDKLVESPFRAVLQHTTDECDPLHLNYVDVLDESVRGIAGLAPGDLVVSLRNISAFAIVDGRDGTFKRLVNGTFFKQHSVQHLEGSRFLLFDNHGAEAGYGPSRLLLVDIATGEEVTVFPNDATPAELRTLFSRVRGKVDISPDRQRVLAVFSEEGKAVEVRLADGAVLGVFTAVSDVSHVAALDERKRHDRAGLFRLYGVDYLVPSP